MKRSATERFWSKVDVGGADECWNWTGARTQGGSGYGNFYLEGRFYAAHRVCWEWTNKQPIPDGIYVCHHCDNRACVNPAHLFLGTHSDNMQDAARKGRNPMQLRPERSYWSQPRDPERQARGERQGCAKLTERQVIEIRSLSRAGLSSSEIGGRFGINSGHIRRIVVGKAWAHVPIPHEEATRDA